MKLILKCIRIHWVLLCHGPGKHKGYTGLDCYSVLECQQIANPVGQRYVIAMAKIRRLMISDEMN